MLESLLPRLTTTNVESFPTNLREFPAPSVTTVSVVLTDRLVNLGENLYFDVFPFFGDSPMGLLTV